MTTHPPGDTHGLLELEQDECLALLGSVPLGRIVHTDRALPTIRPVNFRLLPGGVYLRTSYDGSIGRAAREGAVVAFEADSYDAEGRYGWSVVVLGRAEEVVDVALLARVADLPLVPWADGRRDDVVRIALELVSGRRAGGPVQVPPVPRSASVQGDGPHQPGAVPGRRAEDARAPEALGALLEVVEP